MKRKFVFGGVSRFFSIRKRRLDSKRNAMTGVRISHFEAKITTDSQLTFKNEFQYFEIK